MHDFGRIAGAEGKIDEPANYLSDSLAAKYKLFEEVEYTISLCVCRAIVDLDQAENLLHLSLSIDRHLHRDMINDPDISIAFKKLTDAAKTVLGCFPEERLVQFRAAFSR